MSRILLALMEGLADDVLGCPAPLVNRRLRAFGKAAEIDAVLREDGILFSLPMAA